MQNNINLTNDYILFEKGFNTWEDAIKAGCKPLLENGKINENYVESIIASVNEFGPYIIIAPSIALPHARPEAGSIEIGLSILKTEVPVPFDDENEANIFITISCVDSNTHLEMLQSIANVISDSTKNEELLAAKTKDEILKLFIWDYEN